MSTLLPMILLALSLVCLAAGFLPRAPRFLRKAGGVLLLCLLLEGVVFNYNAITTKDLIPQELLLESAAVTVEELPGERTYLSAVTPSGQEIAPVYRTTVTIEGLAAECETIALSFEGDNVILDAEVYVQDAAYSRGFAPANTVKVAPGSEKHRSATAMLDSNGTLTAVQIVFKTEDPQAKLTRAALNEPVSYQFSLLRYAALCLPLLLLAAVLHFKWHLIVLDRKNALHRAVYAAAALVCVLAVIWVQYLCIPFDTTRFPYTRALEYPFEKSVYDYRTFAHAVMFDSLARVQTHVEQVPSEDMLQMEDPYDPTERVAQGVEYMFDYAFYEGKYYAYFGLTPVLVFYAPFYALMGYLPSYTTAALFFALMSVLAAFLCLWEAARRFARKPGLVMLCLCGAALTFGSNILMLQSCADRYHLSIQSMQLFFFLTLYLALRACREKKRSRRSLWFALSGLSTVLLVWSRATGALSAAAFVAPLFIGVALNKKEKVFDRMRDAASFLIPVALGAAVIMLYNMARFDSPFEFGQKYQITTESIAYNTFNLRSALQAIYYFFFDGLKTVPEFPYLTVAEQFVNRTGNYFYGVCNAGAFTMPLALCVFLLPLIREKRKNGKVFCYGLSLLMTVIIAISGFLVAGVAQRYVCDILPALCLIGALCALDVTAADAGEGRNALQAIYYFFFDRLKTVPEFPYLTVAEQFVNRTGNYFYGVCNAGAFTMPLALCVFLLPLIREKRKNGKVFCYGLSLLMTVIIAISGFLVAGVAQRYVCDILPALCLIGALCALDVTAADAGEGRNALQGIMAAACVMTIAVGLAMTFSNYRCFISEYAPDKYLHLFRLFTLM